MDRYFAGVATISNSPEGTLDDGLPLDREKIGPMEIGGEPVEIGLVRVKDKDYDQIWLIASETVARVPALHKAMENTWIERVMPEALLKYKPFGISLAQYLAWAGSIGLPLLLLSLLSFVAIVLARTVIRNPRGRSVLDSWYGGMRWPGILVLTLGIHLASLSALGFSLRFRILYGRTVAALLIVAVAFLIHRLAVHLFDYITGKMQTREYASTRSAAVAGRTRGQRLDRRGGGTFDSHTGRHRYRHCSGRAGNCRRCGGLRRPKDRREFDWRTASACGQGAGCRGYVSHLGPSWRRLKTLR